MSYLLGDNIDQMTFLITDFRAVTSAYVPFADGLYLVSASKLFLETEKAGHRLQVGRYTACVTLSFGIAFDLNKADQALYRAKCLGRNRYAFYDADLDRSDNRLVSGPEPDSNRGGR